LLAYAIAYVSTALVFVAADFVWLSLAGPRLYKPVLGPMLAEKVNLTAALAFYLIYVAGLVFLAVAPSLKADQWRVAAMNGLVLGVVAYATYDLTNQATLRIWSTRLTLLDMIWGAALSALAASAAFFAARRFV
jgi:uncharacterized membrane protein